MSVSLATQAVGAVVTATRLNNYPQGLLGYTQVTSNASATSGTTVLDLVTASAVTISTAVRRIKITFHCRGMSCTVAGTDVYTVRIQEGATIFGESNYSAAVLAASATGGCDFAAYLDSPSAASHTYKVTIQRAIGSGAATAQASANGPMYIAIEDVGISP
jgi:hypothetical protein